MESIAFFGGSFNPPSNIHLEIGRNVINNLNINKVCFVPVGNYYKKKDLIDVKYRYEMLEIMCENEKDFFVSDITLNEKNNLKAIDIFEMIKEKYINNDIYYIMGSDNFERILDWKNPEELVENYKIIIVKRDNIDIDKIIIENEILHNNKQNLYILDLENTKNKIDSTQIRNKINNQDNVEEYLNQNVVKYIYDNRLYF